MLPVKELTIFTDGASRGNPGEAGAGAIIYGEQGVLIKKITKYLGTTTNNVAEYMALIIALNEALALNGKVVHLFSDSELMVRQIKGIYKVRDRKMQALWREVKKLLAQFTQYDITCIVRGEIKKQTNWPTWQSMNKTDP